MEEPSDDVDLLRYASAYSVVVQEILFLPEMLIACDCTKSFDLLFVRILDVF